MNIVEQAEKDAVIALLFTDFIPKAGNWEVLESWGLQKEEIGNTLFYKAILPNNWTKILDENNHRIIYLVDPLGKQRAYIFFKAGIYDRKADIAIIS